MSIERPWRSKRFYMQEKSSADDQPSSPLTGPIGQNIDSILAYYSKEEQKISRSQRIAENVSKIVGRPIFLGSTVLLVVLWMLYNSLALNYGWIEIDPPPFFWLEGLISLLALLVTIVVLTKQNRLAKLEELRAHLDLQINLLTEQKSTKLIELLEELRSDLPMVKHRHDPEAEALKQHTDPHQVLAAMDEVLDAGQTKVAERQSVKRK